MLATAWLWRFCMTPSILYGSAHSVSEVCWLHSAERNFAIELALG